MQDVPYRTFDAPAPLALNHALPYLRSLSPPMLAIGLFLTLAGSVLTMILQRTGGASLYTLDDPYIHLALAERIALHGSYGINVGEFTSPSSSIVWPLLLLPSAGTPLHAWMPLLLCVFFGALAAWLLGGFASELPMQPGDRWANVKRLVVAGCLVLATNITGLVFTGMEHNLQILIAVVAAVGVVAVWQGYSFPLWMLAVVALGPAVRYELFAVVAAVALVLAGHRRWAAAIGLVLASLVLPALFAAYLVANGNAPLPNSVLAKLLENYAQQGSGDSAGLLGALHKISTNIRRHVFPVLLMSALVIATLALLYRSPRGIKRIVLLAALAVGLLHFAGGRFGWFYRYELYAVAFIAIVCMWAAFELAPHAWPVPLLALACLAGYYANAIVKTPGAAHNIYEQQFQMHRFVAAHYDKSFAVNDLGWVSYGLDANTYVLDLWGLASNEAVRQYPKTAVWLDDVTSRHRTGLAMIYPDWFEAIPENWTRVGELRLSGKRVTASQDRVVFFATAAGNAGEIRAKLEAFKLELPPGVKLEIVGR